MATEAPSLAAYLAQQLSRAQITQRELSRLSGYSPAEINRWVKGHRPLHLRALWALARILGERSSQEPEAIAGSLVRLCAELSGEEVVNG